MIYDITDYYTIMALIVVLIVIYDYIKFRH